MTEYTIARTEFGLSIFIRYAFSSGEVDYSSIKSVYLDSSSKPEDGYQKEISEYSLRVQIIPTDSWDELELDSEISALEEAAEMAGSEGEERAREVLEAMLTKVRELAVDDEYLSYGGLWNDPSEWVFTAKTPATNLSEIASGPMSSAPIEGHINSLKALAIEMGTLFRNEDWDDVERTLVAESDAKLNGLEFDVSNYEQRTVDLEDCDEDGMLPELSLEAFMTLEELTERLRSAGLAVSSIDCVGNELYVYWNGKNCVHADSTSCSNTWELAYKFSKPDSNYRLRK